MRIQQIQERLAARFGHPVTLLPAGRMDRVMLFGFRPKEDLPFLVCQLSRSQEGALRLRRQAERRSSVWKNLPAKLQRGMPWAEIEGSPTVSLLSEPYLKGKPLAVQSGLKGLNDCAATTLGWLKEFQEATAAPASPSLIAQQAEELLRLSEKTFPPEILRQIPFLRRRLSLLEPLRPCAVHGDFWLGNLLMEDGALQVLDWEYILPQGNPLFDPLLHLLSLATQRAGNRLTGFERCFLKPSPEARVMGHILDDHAPNCREAFCLTLALVLLELTRRELQPVQDSLHFPLLETFLRRPDPIEAVRSSLWPA